MSACEALAANAPNGVAASLRAVDCLANEVTQVAFGRLFGSGGALGPALTIILTLYIAFFALSLLTGRSRIGISALTPRMMTLGLVLTFATSWVAYQGVVWNLAIGAPDQLAGVLMGTKGSATQIFADRIDMIFVAISQVADAGVSPAGAAQNAAASSSFAPGNLMWLGALLLLLGTVGVLVTARIALAVLLALGPVFVICALFPGTRGLTAGWLRGVVLTAITPLFVVVGGGITLELLVPVVAALGDSGEGASGRGALGLFLIASIHLALMAMVTRVAGAMVAGWQVFGLSGSGGEERGNSADSKPVSQPDLAVQYSGLAAAPAAALRRTITGPALAASTVEMTPAQGVGGPPAGSRTATIRQIETTAIHTLPLRQQQRARGVGSRFRSAPRLNREMFR